MRILWRNPHSEFVLSTAGGEEWELQSGAINTLERKGITRETIAVGDRVRAAGWADRRGGKSMFLTNLLLPDGNEFLLKFDIFAGIQARVLGFGALSTSFQASSDST